MVWYNPFSWGDSDDSDSGSSSDSSSSSGSSSSSNPYAQYGATDADRIAFDEEAGLDPATNPYLSSNSGSSSSSDSSSSSSGSSSGYQPPAQAQPGYGVTDQDRIEHDIESGLIPDDFPVLDDGGTTPPLPPGGVVPIIDPGDLVTIPVDDGLIQPPQQPIVDDGTYYPRLPEDGVPVFDPGELGMPDLPPLVPPPINEDLILPPRVDPDDPVTGDPVRPAPQPAIEQPEPDPRPEPDPEPTASDTYADLINDQWADYQQRYLPVQQELLHQASDAGAVEQLDQMLGRIHANVNQAHTSAIQRADIQRQHYGLTQDKRQKQAFSRQSGMQQALSTAQAANASRAHISDRRDQLITGASGGTRQEQRLSQ